MRMDYANANDLTLEKAQEIFSYVEEKAKEIGVPMVCTVVDAGGNILLLNRMNNALIVSVEVSMNKAYTAIALKLPTHILADACAPGGSLYGLQNYNNGRVVIFGGGYPLVVDGKIVGGLGVSGGSVEEDMTCASYALEKAFA